jgi:REP element-mobilizing transposase RayT
MCVYGYVAMPEHVHLLVNEPCHSTLADAMHYLKLCFAKRMAYVDVEGHGFSRTEKVPTSIEAPIRRNLRRLRGPFDNLASARLLRAC